MAIIKLAKSKLLFVTHQRAAVMISCCIWRISGRNSTTIYGFLIEILEFHNLLFNESNQRTGPLYATLKWLIQKNLLNCFQVPWDESGTWRFFIFASEIATEYADVILINHIALDIGTWYSLSWINISSFLLNIGT